MVGFYFNFQGKKNSTSGFNMGNLELVKVILIKIFLQVSCLKCRCYPLHAVEFTCMCNAVTNSQYKDNN